MHRADLGRRADFAGEHSIRHVRRDVGAAHS